MDASKARLDGACALLVLALLLCTATPAQAITLYGRPNVDDSISVSTSEITLAAPELRLELLSSSALSAAVFETTPIRVVDSDDPVAAAADIEIDTTFVPEAWRVSIVPEPGTASLVVWGLGLIAARRARAFSRTRA